jgi:MFS family permease
MQKTGRQEWAAMWPLPLVAMFGVSGSCIIVYSSGVFLAPLTRQFGWSRAEYSLSITLMMLLGLIAMPLGGRLSDRLGPRRVVLFGMAPFMLILSSLGLANGPITVWWALSLVLSAVTGLIAPAIWISAVAQRFEAARGLALGVVLAGIGVGGALWPVLANLYIAHLGWRFAFPALALTWGVIALPATLRFFYGARDLGIQPDLPASAQSASWLKMLASPVALCITASGGLLSCTSLGVQLHVVPLLTGKGMDTGLAAAIAGATGLAAIAGRVATGFLLDRLPTRLLSIVLFLSPLITLALLAQPGGGVAAALAAVAVLGFAAGAMTDIITFIAARQFGHLFGSVYSAIMAILAVCASVGPILAGALFDATGSYGPFLLALAPMVCLSAALIAITPAPMTHKAH